MKCPYVKQLICDYPVSTGDIICTTCPHYLKPAKTSALSLLISRIKALFV
jgi:hypothetical protein